MFEQREDNTHSKKNIHTYSFEFRTEYTQTNVQKQEGKSSFSFGKCAARISWIDCQDFSIPSIGFI